ncbi:hypothetical protein BDR26DRAFT_907771 [Obelidium mucronatum]|nr:hypothetical protein BDR26DRAFT_907771 [Obelidium mucronatum]
MDSLASMLGLLPPIQNQRKLQKLSTGDRPFLGTRPITNGIAGPYIWQTYNEVYKRIRNFGSGLMLSLPPRPTSDTTTNPNNSSFNNHVGIFALNRPEWIIVEQACFMHSLTQTSVVVATRDKAKFLLDLYNTNRDVLSLGKQVGVNVVGMVDLERLGREKMIGTTGTPKGAILTHENMLSLLKGTTLLSTLQRFGGLQPDDTYISYLPLAHVFERTMITCLIHIGARIGFYQGDTLKLMDDVLELAPTIFPSVPRLANRIYDKVKNGIKSSIPPHQAGGLFHYGYQTKQENLKSGIVVHPVWDFFVFNSVQQKLGGRVRIILTGAAPISKNVLDFLRICFSCQVYEGYGLTETCSMLTVTDRCDCTADQVGSPVPGCQVKLIDVPEMNYSSTRGGKAEQGEICVRGPNVFKGYYQNQSETEKVLDKDGWFHTGDVGEWDPQGRLKIIDRKKSIFKLSQGEYIAPEKIEGVGMYHKTYKDLCLDEGVRKAFTKTMEEHGRQHGLKGFENVKAVFLESDLNAFTIENGLLTPVFKLKRFAARQFYEKDIEDMYSALRL